MAKAYGNAVITALADYGDGKPVKATMSVNVSEGLMNDQFTVENIWQPFGNFTHREFEWMENDGVLRIFPVKIRLTKLSAFVATAVLGST